MTTYTKPSLRKSVVARVKAGTKGGAAGQWSARKAQLAAQAYEAGMAAGMENVGGGAGMSVNRKKGGKIKAKKKGGAPHNRLY